MRALEDALATIDKLSFPIDTADRRQMLNIVNSCVGTKFTTRFGDLIAVRACVCACARLALPHPCLSSSSVPSFFLGFQLHTGSPRALET